MPTAVSLMLLKHTAARRLPAFCKEGQREALFHDLISKRPRSWLGKKMEQYKRIPKTDGDEDPLLWRKCQRKRIPGTKQACLKILGYLR